MHILLVIDSNPANNWYRVFKGLKGPDGEEIRVEQTQWDLIEAWADDAVHLTVHPSPEPILGSSQKYERSFTPDFVLVRNFVLGIHGQSWLNTLMALRVGNVPAVNSLDSVFFSTQRALMIAELKRIQGKLGKDVFPLVPIRYYPNTRHHLPKPKDLPLVAKVGTSHAGYGKMKFKDDDFADFSTLMAMYSDYITTEPFVPNVGDVRIQRVGDQVRAYRRVTAGWKGNVGEAEVEDIPVTPLYQLWADECSKIFGGLDILSIDAVVDEKGNHTILEVNDTATGLNPFHQEEDTAHIRDLVLRRMTEAFNATNSN